MKKVTLTRQASTDEGTFGVLEIANDAVPGGLELAAASFKCLSLELPDRQNAAGKSCIPAGVYTCTLRYSPDHGSWLYGVDNVPGRSDIEIHPANWAGDTDKGYYSELRGCIALGFGTAIMPTPRGNQQKAVTSSKAAIGAFMTALANQPFELTIVGLK
jgi:hypothetical protein